MSGEDSELESLKAKRLAEMQKNISRTQSEKPTHTEKQPDTRGIVLSRLGYRGLEVLEKAELQFPHETELVMEKLAELIRSGEIREQLDGGNLLSLFRSIGLHVKIDTKINVEHDGKFVSLNDKLRNESDGGTQRE